MEDKKKFIVTNNKSVAEHLIAKGVKLVSKVSDAWTFENKLPNNFCFSEIDKSQIAYTNILSL